MPVVKDSVVLYAKVNTPALEYQKEAVKDKPWMNKEYVVDVLMTEAWYKKLKKKYKTVKSVREAAVLDSKEFLERYKIEAPEGFENDDGELFIVKFKKKAYYKDGNEGYAPTIVGVKNKKFDKNGEKVVDGVDLGNGTVAHVQFNERTWDNQFGKGMALDLQAICVLDLVKYESAGGGELEFEFEEDDDFGDDMTDESGIDTPDTSTQDDDGEGW